MTNPVAAEGAWCERGAHAHRHPGDPDRPERPGWRRGRPGPRPARLVRRPADPPRRRPGEHADPSGVDRPDRRRGRRHRRFLGHRGERPGRGWGRLPSPGGGTDLGRGPPRPPPAWGAQCPGASTPALDPRRAAPRDQRAQGVRGRDLRTLRLRRRQPRADDDLRPRHDLRRAPIRAGGGRRHHHPDDDRGPCGRRAGARTRPTVRTQRCRARRAQRRGLRPPPLRHPADAGGARTGPPAVGDARR